MKYSIKNSDNVVLRCRKCNEKTTNKGTGDGIGTHHTATFEGHLGCGGKIVVLKVL